jgi:2,5-diketo-D-gluconate reductase A
MKLSSGHEIPYIGLGVWESGPSVCAEACLAAFEVGYTHIDTAACYFNEKEVGEAVAKTLVNTISQEWRLTLRRNLAREKLFITTKVWDDAAGYDATLKAVRASLNKAKLEYFDLILLHSALPGPEKRHGSWKALEECVEKGLVRSIGVSNWSVKVSLAPVVKAFS